jgi:putative heme-binding domain-containing protein
MWLPFRRGCCVVIFSLWVLTLAAPAAAQLHIGEYDPADVQRGALLFSTRCTTCHGNGGDQVPGVALLSGRFRRASSDEDLTTLIRNGIPGTGMPPGNYSAAEVTALVAYLRSTGTATAAVAKGDPMRGRTLFEGKGACRQCHRVQGVGGFRGPNLSDIGASRSEQSLLESLVTPSAEVVPLNQEIRAVTRTGRTIVGRRMNEDTHSIQLILEEQGRLVSLLKSDLKEMTVSKTSPMPAIGDRLTGDELSDLLAYLRSLRPID